MTVKIVEKISDKQQSKQKYDNHSGRRAFYFEGNIWVWNSEKQRYSYYSNESGDLFWWGLGVCQQLKLLGFQLSRELQHRCDVESEKKARYRAAQKADLQAKKALACKTGKPVVISSWYYQTTASVGTNFQIAMPNGDLIGVTNGTPTSSHGDRVGTTNDDAEIQAAIREHFKEELSHRL